MRRCRSPRLISPDAGLMRDALILRHTIVRAMRDYLNAHDFLDLETPILTRSTPEGAGSRRERSRPPPKPDAHRRGALL